MAHDLVGFRVIVYVKDFLTNFPMRQICCDHCHFSIPPIYIIIGFRVIMDPTSARLRQGYQPSGGSEILPVPPKST